MNLPSYIEKTRDGCWLLHVRVQPKASRTEWAGLHGERVKIRLAAPPVDNKANRELLRFLSKTFEVPARSISISKGLRSRNKTLRIEEVGLQNLLSHLPGE